MTATEYARVTIGAQTSEALSALADQARRSVVLVQSSPNGAGSGMMWRSDGMILTNQHVVAGSREVRIVTHDNREAWGEVIASDAALDLAVVRVAALQLPVLQGGVRAARVGELVIAVGNPWGERGVVTLGIVNGTGEIAVPWRRRTAHYLRSDVLLAPGNSGGALLNMRGEVVGVNAMIFGGDLSVAIPTEVVDQFLEQRWRS